MVLGITGISGSGKHTAATYFSERGWVVLDADKIAHYLYRPYTHVWKAVVDTFGEAILNENDTISRQKLGAIVFDETHPLISGKKRFALNQIVHPAIRHYLKEQIHRQFQRKTNIVIVAALWKEMELSQVCDQVLLITSDPRLAIERIKKKDGISESNYRQRVKDQSITPDPDYTVQNNGTIPELFRALMALKLG